MWRLSARLLLGLILAAVLTGFASAGAGLPADRPEGLNSLGQQGDPGFKSGRGNGRLGGRITDLEGHPLAGIEVRLVFSQIDTLVYKDKTNKRGDFAFAGLGSGYWNLTVIGSGFELYTASINVSQVSANPPVRVKLKKSESPVAGWVEDPASMADLDKGRRLLDEKKFAEALPLLEAFLAKNPSAMGARLWIGDCRREMGQFEEAEADYRTVLDQAAADTASGAELTARAWLGLGATKLKQGKTSESGGLFQKAVQASPRDEALAYAIGEICYAGKDTDEAARYFRLASQIRSDWPDPILMLGYVHLGRNENAEAAAQFEKFLALEPQGERAASVKTILVSIRK